MQVSDQTAPSSTDDPVTQSASPAPLGPPLARDSAGVQIESVPEPPDVRRAGTADAAFAARDGLIEERSAAAQEAGPTPAERVAVVERSRGAGVVVDDGGQEAFSEIPAPTQRTASSQSEPREPPGPRTPAQQVPAPAADGDITMTEVSHSTPYSSANGVGSSDRNTGSMGLPLCELVCGSSMCCAADDTAVLLRQCPAHRPSQNRMVRGWATTRPQPSS